MTAPTIAPNYGAGMPEPAYKPTTRPCPYCQESGERAEGDTMVVCRWCAGTGQMGLSQFETRMLDVIEILVADVRAAMGNAAAAVPDGGRAIDRMARAAVAVLFPHGPRLDLSKPRIEDPEKCREDAASMLAVARAAGRQPEDVVADLLRSCRTLYGDAELVRVEYGEQTRQAYDQREETLRDAADAFDALRRVKQAVRGVRTGRSGR